MDRNFIEVESDNSNIKPLDNNTSNNSNNIQEIKPVTDKNILLNLYLIGIYYHHMIWLGGLLDNDYLLWNDRFYRKNEDSS